MLVFEFSNRFFKGLQSRFRGFLMVFPWVREAVVSVKVFSRLFQSLSLFFRKTRPRVTQITLHFALLDFCSSTWPERELQKAYRPRNLLILGGCCRFLAGLTGVGPVFKGALTGF